MVINHWKPQFTKQYGHHWPDTYMCIDTEYTGGNDQKDVICEIGHTIVERGQVVDQLSIILNWLDHPIVPRQWLLQSLGRIHGQMGSAWRITPEVMSSEGMQPEKALKFYYTLMKTWRQRGLPFVAHNGFHADERMLRGHFEGFLQKRFRFGDNGNGLIDTGAIFKATQALACDNPNLNTKLAVWLPQPADTLETYFRRVVNYPAKGIYWKLWKCIEHFGLDVKYKLKEEDCHGALHDSYLTHLLMEEYRSKVTVNNSQESPVDSPDALARMFDQEMAKVGQQRELKAQADDEFEARQGESPRRPKDFARRRRQRSV